MKHLKEALSAIHVEELHGEFIKVAGNAVVFQIQDGPINEKGQNGVQASDMLLYVHALIHSLDQAYPCQENKKTLEHLQEAIGYQDDRTRNRNSR